MMLNLWLVRAVYQALRAKRAVKTITELTRAHLDKCSCHMLTGSHAR